MLSEQDSKITYEAKVTQNQTASSIRSPTLSIDDLTMNNKTNAIEEPVSKLNSKSINEYISSLHKELHELRNENDELKVNFVQVSELLEKEKVENEKKEKLYQTQIEILEKEKKRHLEQNAIDKENLEILLDNEKKENDKLRQRIKELSNDNEKLRGENFNLNVRIIELNKIEYENTNLKSRIKEQLELNSSKKAKNSNHIINKQKTYTKKITKSPSLTPTKIKKSRSDISPIKINKSKEASKTNFTYHPSQYKKITQTNNNIQKSSSPNHTLINAYYNYIEKINVSIIII